MDRTINVLMTGAGAPGGPGIIHALQKDPNIRLVVADADPMAAGGFMDIDFVQIPTADDPSFIDVLMKICRENQIQVVFPLVTRELNKLSAEKQRFEAKGIQVIVSEFNSLEIANNKRKLLEHLQAAGIPIPDFRTATTVEALRLACLELGYPTRPVVIKPSTANGSRGVRILDAQKDRFELLFNEKPGNLYSNLEEILMQIGEHPLPELLVMEYLPGDEYSVDCLVGDGQPLVIVPRKRLKMINGITVKGVFEKNEEIVSYTEAILHSLPLNGPIGLQVKADGNGLFRIMEINPRIQGTSTAAIGAGVNFPILAVYQALQLTLPLPTEIKWGTFFARYYENLFNN
jgi:carbamoyl-phosphate synthase large subunit